MQFLNFSMTAMTGLMFLVNFSTAFSGEPMSVSSARDAVLNMSLSEAVATSSGFLNSITDPGPSDSAESRLKFTKIQAMLALRDDKHEAAIELLTIAMSVHTPDVELLWLRARAFAGKNDHALAKKDCQAALAIDREFIPAWLTLAGSTMDTDGPEAAIKLLDNLSFDHSDDSYLFYLKGVGRLRRGEFSQAAEHFEEAITANATLLPVPACRLWCLRGIALEKAGNLNLALNSAMRAFEANERDRQSLLLLWKLQRQSNLQVAALATAKTMVAASPNEMNAEMALMASLVDVRQFAAAEIQAKRILNLDPHNQTAIQVAHKIQAARENSISEIR